MKYLIFLFLSYDPTLPLKKNFATATSTLTVVINIILYIYSIYKHANMPNTVLLPVAVVLSLLYVLSFFTKDSEVTRSQYAWVTLLNCIMLFTSISGANSMLEKARQSYVDENNQGNIEKASVIDVLKHLIFPTHGWFTTEEIHKDVSSQLLQNTISTIDTAQVLIKTLVKQKVTDSIAIDTLTKKVVTLRSQYINALQTNIKSDSTVEKLKNFIINMPVTENRVRPEIIQLQVNTDLTRDKLVKEQQQQELQKVTQNLKTVQLQNSSSSNGNSRNKYNICNNSSSSLGVYKSQCSSNSCSINKNYIYICYMPQQLTVTDFTEHDSVKNCLVDLKKEFGPEGKPFIVSDVLDNEGHQYVNLVQKGGGVLGIALVGYTYILEQMGIRFIRLAGTSAGAINTALMVVTGTKQDAKSVPVLDEICKLKFIDLVDGHPAAKWLISKFITHQDFGIKVKRWVIGIVMTLAILLVGNFIFLGLQHAIPWISIVTKLFFVLTGVWLLLIAIIAVYISTLLKRLKDSGFGINPGDFFYDWIKKLMIANDVKTVTDLNNKASAPVPGLYLRVQNREGLNGLQGDVTFITSELVSQNKIQFPEMWNLFRKNIDELQPAGFIRASMSIPVFFESYFINNIPCDDEDIKNAWMERFGEKDPPSGARFVDGGILSNFPINLFYNPKVVVPRLPSFGIDLDDSEPGDQGKNAESWSLLGYFGRIFNTIRFYYDKDFLIKNKVYKKGIGTIQLHGYNWLNFFLSDEDKINMFVKGAEAAKDFLINFDWNDYKSDRDKMRKELIKEQTL